MRLAHSWRQLLILCLSGFSWVWVQAPRGWGRQGGGVAAEQTARKVNAHAHAFS